MPEESVAEIKQVTPANGPTEKLKIASFPQYREGAETVRPLI